MLDKYGGALLPLVTAVWVFSKHLGEYGRTESFVCGNDQTSSWGVHQEAFLAEDTLPQVFFGFLRV